MNHRPVNNPNHYGERPRRPHQWVTTESAPPKKKGGGCAKIALGGVAALVLLIGVATCSGPNSTDTTPAAPTTTISTPIATPGHQVDPGEPIPAAPPAPTKTEATPAAAPAPEPAGPNFEAFPGGATSSGQIRAWAYKELGCQADIDVPAMGALADYATVAGCESPDGRFMWTVLKPTIADDAALREWFWTTYEGSFGSDSSIYSTRGRIWAFHSLDLRTARGVANAQGTEVF